LIVNQFKLSPLGLAVKEPWYVVWILICQTWLTNFCTDWLQYEPAPPRPPSHDGIPLLVVISIQYVLIYYYLIIKSYNAD